MTRTLLALQGRTSRSRGAPRGFASKPTDVRRSASHEATAHRTRRRRPLREPGDTPACGRRLHRGLARIGVLTTGSPHPLRGFGSTVATLVGPFGPLVWVGPWCWREHWPTGQHVAPRAPVASPARHWAGRFPCCTHRRPSCLRIQPSAPFMTMTGRSVRHGGDLTAFYLRWENGC